MTTETDLKREYVRFILDYTIDDCLHDDYWPEVETQRPVINVEPPDVE
jgi:hypothetical protein